MSDSEVLRTRAQYSAGFLDGRGCISVGRSVQVVIGSRDPGRLHWLVDRWGGRVYRSSADREILSGGHEYWEWRLQDRAHLVPFLEAIRPHVIFQAGNLERALTVLRRVA